MDGFIVAKTVDELKNCVLLPRMANRHGLVTGATGTGKTVTLQALAENFSKLGVPVFAPDIKGDLSGISQAGGQNEKISQRLSDLKINGHDFEASPVELWDVFGDQGTPVRATVSDMGPLLFARLLVLNDTQTGVLNIIFKIADDNGMLLLDLKDLRAMSVYVGENAKDFTLQYGNVSTASIGAIQRGLLAIESQGGDKFFGEPAVKVTDLMRQKDGMGVINLLAADKLFQSPLLYSTFMLWLLSEIYEELPEVGDLDKPKMVFFFDEAHLLFKDAPTALLDKIEQVIRLVRSKGVGIFFVTQNPADIPANVLGQLGNRIQHALRAFTPLEQRGIKAAAETFRPNPKIDIEKVITELGVGEALVSFLDEKGTPGITERGWIIPPRGQVGAIDPMQRNSVINNSQIRSSYETPLDPQSAYEVLKVKTDEKMAAEQTAAETKAEQKAKSGYKKDNLGDTLVKSTVRSIGYGLGRQILRGVLGGIFKGK